MSASNIHSDLPHPLNTVWYRHIPSVAERRTRNPLEFLHSTPKSNLPQLSPFEPINRSPQALQSILVQKPLPVHRSLHSPLQHMPRPAQTRPSMILIA